MGLNIRQVRIDRNWTQDYVAQQVGVTLSSIQKIETGQRKPSYDVLVKLEDLFEKGHRDLMAEANEGE